MHYSLLYISRFAVPVSSKTLDDIRTESSVLNQTANISGLLLSTPGYFCQFLQGSRMNVEETMVRITRDRRHRELLVLLKTDLPETLFPDWGMATSLIPEGEIAKEIEQAYQDRLADLSAVDRIMSIMQRFRPIDGVENPAVIIDSDLNKKLALTKLATQGNAVQGLLNLGRSIFTNSDIALTIREPGNNGYSTRTSNEMNTDIVALLQNHFPNAIFSNEEKNCRIDSEGNVKWSPALPNERKTSAISMFVKSPYKEAIGVAV